MNQLRFKRETYTKRQQKQKFCGFSKLLINNYQQIHLISAFKTSHTVSPIVLVLIEDNVRARKG